MYVTHREYIVTSCVYYAMPIFKNIYYSYTCTGLGSIGRETDIMSAANLSTPIIYI